MAFCFITSCSNPPVEKNGVVLEDYPQLAAHIVERNFSAMKEYREHQKHEVSSLAWRATAKSTPDDLAEFISEAIETDSYAAWYALGLQEPDEEQVNRIAESYSSGQIQSEGVCEVFFRHGKTEQLNVLLTRSRNTTNSEICSLAVGGILTREKISENSVKEIFEQAFSNNDPIIRRNLLYGFYRGRLNNPEPGSDLHKEIMTLWIESGIENAQVDQYMIRALGSEAVNRVMDSYSDKDLENNIQLSVELAMNLDEYDHGKDHGERLLNHSNPHVVIATLETLRSYNTISPPFLKEIESRFASRSRNHEMFITSLEILQRYNISVQNYLQKLGFTERENPFLTNRILSIYKQIDTDERFLIRLSEKMENGGIEGLHAAQALSGFWLEQEGNSLRERVREIVFDQLNTGNRSAISGLSTILTDEMIIEDEDFDRLSNLYSDFRESGEPENAMALSTALQERYPDRFDEEYAPEKTFRTPNWQRLYDLGVYPIWTLETEKGRVEIQLDPLSAPFTVSSIDSLTRAGVYDDVVFHRVVKNFVVQGGDFERRDGLGGPDYTLPTEPSFESFERGAVGIASSGTDTEGAQYFIMHQWAPHLDGNYTRFGRVIRGMDVVDRMQVGDRVLKAEIY